MKAAASAAQLWPVRLEAKGCHGLHQTSELRLCPASPNASTEAGKSSALPTVAARGRKPCWAAWVQKVVKSGGSTTPVTISAPLSLNAEICAEK